MIRFCLIIIYLTISATLANADRIKDMATIAGVRSNPLMGYGIVVGLAGTGDGNSGLTQQSMQSMMSRMGLAVEVGDIGAKNTAAVMVTADLGPFLKIGQAIDVTVSTIGQAKSLQGGTLLMTPLMGADGEIYAIAQGNLIVGGFGAEGADGSSIRVNVPTVGRVPNGATVERMVESPFQDSEHLMLNLNRGDFSTAASVAEAVNDAFGGEVAAAIDSTSIRVRVPIDPDQRVSFVGILENISVTPSPPPARVVVNSRTGTVVIGGDVLVTPAAVTHGSLTVTINENFNVDQGAAIAMNNGQTVVAPAEPVVTPDSEIQVNDAPARAFVFDPGVSLASLVDAINAVGASPGDLVAILEALREAGALRAELVVI